VFGHRGHVIVGNLLWRSICSQTFFHIFRTWHWLRSWGCTRASAVNSPFCWRARNVHLFRSGFKKRWWPWCICGEHSSLRCCLELHRAALRAQLDQGSCCKQKRSHGVFLNFSHLWLTGLFQVNDYEIIALGRTAGLLRSLFGLGFTARGCQHSVCNHL